MKTFLKLTAVTQFVVACSLAVNVSAAEKLGTLKNLERDRASFIATLIDRDLSPAQREQSLKNNQRQLVDLERMVIRDDRLNGSKSSLVRAAFKNYDLTFLVHASAEKGVSPADLWFEQVGLTGDVLNKSRKLYR